MGIIIKVVADSLCVGISLPALLHSEKWHVFVGEAGLVPKSCQWEGTGASVIWMGVNSH